MLCFYRNRVIDLYNKSMGWILYGWNIGFKWESKFIFHLRFI